MWASYIYSDADLRERLTGPIKKKIETCVRRPAVEESAPILTRCPISGQMIPQMELTCPTTKAYIPMCVLTGRHMELDDWCLCPVTGMPALYTEYKNIAEKDEALANEGAPRERKVFVLDPIFGKEVKVHEISKVSLMY